MRSLSTDRAVSPLTRVVVRAALQAGEDGAVERAGVLVA
jgi:hypothetical protein